MSLIIVGLHTRGVAFDLLNSYCGFNKRMPALHPRKMRLRGISLADAPVLGALWVEMYSMLLRKLTILYLRIMYDELLL